MVNGLDNSSALQKNNFSRVSYEMLRQGRDSQQIQEFCFEAVRKEIRGGLLDAEKTDVQKEGKFMYDLLRKKKGDQIMYAGTNRFGDKVHPMDGNLKLGVYTLEEDPRICLANGHMSFVVSREEEGERAIRFASYRRFMAA